jgi:hypothetical protein
LGGFFIANPVARLEVAEAGRTDYTVVRIPRAREVSQSYLSAVASFLWAFLACLRPVTQHQVRYQGQPFGLLFRKYFLWYRKFLIIKKFLITEFLIDKDPNRRDPNHRVPVYEVLN